MWINKNINLFTSIIVGITFMFSGVVKLNDPLGFADKIEEYLHVFASQFTPRFLLFIPYTLVLAVFIATVELVLGTALLIHFQHTWTLRILLLLTLFFTGLTCYTAVLERVASCGCFGDAFALTPWQSFAKSVLLLLLLGCLYWQRETGATSSLSGYGWLATALLLAWGLSWYAIHHLPVIDFSPYKVGKNLSQLTQPRAPLRYVYVLEKDGSTIETDHYPQEPGYKLIATRLDNPEDMPVITNFNIWRGANDCTQAIQTDNKLLIIAQNPSPLDASTLTKLQSLLKRLTESIQPILLTTSDNTALAEALQLPLHMADAKLLKAMLRAKLGLLLLNNGVIVGKWHYIDLERTYKTLEHLGWLHQRS